MLQIGNTFCKLPGGRLKPDEDAIEGLKCKLTSKLAPNCATPPEWQVGKCIAVWWGPNFETLMHPYCPPLMHPSERHELVKRLEVLKKLDELHLHVVVGMAMNKR